MSLAERARKAGAKILTLDIERMKGEASVEFWDLGDFKNRRISAGDVTAWPRTICVAWKFLNEPVQFAAEWQGDDFLHRVYAAVDAADAVVAHNSRFDLRHLNTAWRDLGLPPPSPYKVIDTLTIARQMFGDESRTLDALCQRLGLIGKVDRYDVEVARAACAGDTKSQNRLARYNKADVLATEELYLRLVGTGWVPGHPHDKRNTDATCCNQCWGTNLTSNGTTIAASLVYALFRCEDCGANVQGGRLHRAATTKGVK